PAITRECCAWSHCVRGTNGASTKPLSAEARANLIPGLVKHGGARVYLAFEENEPVGLALCFVGFSSFRAKPLINIHDIAVRPQVRGRGIGRQLLSAVEQDARTLGCCKV